MARDLFATLDLNLLKTLLVLGQEENMRRAAERLFVTQPAVSQALKKLRHHFDDELFIRTPKGMQPTAFTDRLLSDLTPLMDELSTTLNAQQEFDPGQIEDSIHIVLSPLIASFLADRLFMAIREAAPQARTQITNWSDHSLDDLSKGVVNLGVNLEIQHSPQEIMLHKLADERFTAYVRKGHPLVKGKTSLDLAELNGCEIAMLLVPDWNDRKPFVRQVMQAHGYDVRIGFRSDMPAAIVRVIRQSDMVYPASSLVEGRMLEGLESFTVKMNDQEFTQTTFAYYHQKNRRNPLTLWLREQIRDFLL